MKSLWNDGETTFEGAHYTVRGARCEPRPESPPRIIVGGGGRRVLTVAAEQADIVGVKHQPGLGREGRRHGGPSLVRALRPLSDLGARGSRRPLRFARAADRGLRRERGREAGAPRHAPHRCSAFPGEEALDLPIVLLGTEDELCERLLERRERWGFSNIVVPGEAMEVFAPVVSRLAGT